MNKPLFTVLEDVFPLEHTQPYNYGELPEYNSNRVIPDYHYKTRPSPSQQYLNYLHQYPDAARAEGVILPRTDSFYHTSRQQTSPIMQTSQFTVQPPFAGGIPYLKNARAVDTMYPMSSNGVYPVNSPSDFQTIGREPFHFNTSTSTPLTCEVILTHIRNCKECSKLLRCDNRIWIVLICVILLMFCITIYLLQRNK